MTTKINTQLPLEGLGGRLVENQKVTRNRRLHKETVERAAGRRFGRLLVVYLIPRKYKPAQALCVCDCGNTSTPQITALTTGNTRSCGCLKDEISKKIHTTHGKSASRAYSIWAGMKRRCYNKNAKNFCRYGALGVGVFSKWKASFKSFYNFLGDPPVGMSLDRYPNRNGNYEPGNVRWATPKQQANNTNSNIRLFWNGMEKTISEWSDCLGIGYNTLRGRIRKKWDINKIFTTPWKKNELDQRTTSKL